MHNNLFGFGHTPDEVYQSIVKDAGRDSKIIRFSDAVAIFCLFGALGDWWGKADLFWIGLFVSAAYAMRVFIDQSNRNFFLHRLDWERAAANER